MIGTNVLRIGVTAVAIAIGALAATPSAGADPHSPNCRPACGHDDNHGGSHHRDRGHSNDGSHSPGSGIHR